MPLQSEYIVPYFVNIDETAAGLRNWYGLKSRWPETAIWYVPSKITKATLPRTSLPNLDGLIKPPVARYDNGWGLKVTATTEAVCSCKVLKHFSCHSHPKQFGLSWATGKILTIGIKQLTRSQLVCPCKVWGTYLFYSSTTWSCDQHSRCQELRCQCHYYSLSCDTQGLRGKCSNQTSKFVLAKVWNIHPLEVPTVWSSCPLAKIWQSGLKAIEKTELVCPSESCRTAQFDIP